MQKAVSLDVQETDQKPDQRIRSLASRLVLLHTGDMLRAIYNGSTTQTSNSSLDILYHCTDSSTGLFISISFIVAKAFLLLPLSAFVLYLGYQRWRQQRSFATTSHSDVFTYHIVAVELIYVFGSAVYLCGYYTGLTEVLMFGIYTSSCVFPGQLSFHVLTCVERYLAVVHPVTYMGLRQSGGVKIRNISTVCVWLLCFGNICVIALSMPAPPNNLNICLLIFSLIAISFCSLRVLCVLIRPGPGDVGGNRERVDQSKQRAFNTITAIMGALWVWFAAFLICNALGNSKLLSHVDGCVALISALWFSLPSNLVLPLLFLHRAGKLLCCH